MKLAGLRVFGSLRGFLGVLAVLVLGVWSCGHVPKAMIFVASGCHAAYSMLL